MFTLRNYQCCKHLWKSCVDHHTFFRLTSIPSSPHPERFDEILLQTFLSSSHRISSRRKIRSSTLPVSSIENSILFPPTFHSSLHLSNPQSPPPKPPRQTLEVSDRFPEKSRRIQLKPDINGRYGFNIKVNPCMLSPSIIMGILQKDENDHPVSIVISKIAWNTPASRANLHQGDLILAMNEIDMHKHSYEEIVNIIRNSHQLELVVQTRNALEESLENIRVNLSSEQFEVRRIVEQFSKISSLFRHYLVEKKH